MPAPLDFNISGWASTKRVRLRNVWCMIDLFAIGCRLERLWISQDGRQEWRADRWPYELELREIGYSKPSETV